MLIVVFRVMMPCSLEGGFQCSSEMLIAIYKTWHGVTTQKTTIDIFSAVETSNVKFVCLLHNIHIFF
jgi:hypothetical protein